MNKMYSNLNEHQNRFESPRLEHEETYNIEKQEEEVTMQDCISSNAKIVTKKYSRQNDISPITQSSSVIDTTTNYNELENNQVPSRTRLQNREVVQRLEIVPNIIKESPRQYVEEEKTNKIVLLKGNLPKNTQLNLAIEALTNQEHLSSPRSKGKFI